MCLLSVQVAGASDFKGFFVTARNSDGEAVGTMTATDVGHQTLCDGRVRTIDELLLAIADE